MEEETNYEFLHRVVYKIPGWLQDFTGIMTMDLLRWQESQGITGPMLEVGVFQGRYFSILLQSAIRTGSRLIGVDTFQYFPMSAVTGHIETHFGNSGDLVRLISALSCDLDAAGLLSELGAPARFISIDGSHERDDVFLDLMLADQLLAVGGVIAVDDFLNPLAIGVNEAVNLYFGTPRRAIPFAYVPNKLLLCRPSQAKKYKEALQGFAVADVTDPRGAAFREALQKDHMQGERILFGQRILIIP